MDAALYDELWEVENRHWWFLARRKIVLSLLDQYAVRRGVERLQVCELGCGTGGNLAAIADRCDVVGVECSAEALQYARQRLGNCVHQGSLPDGVPLPPGSFDVVLMTDVLEHIEDDAGSAQAAMNLLRPGGVLIATVPAYQWLYSPRDAHHHHFRRYSKRAFRALWQQANAEPVLLSHYNSLLFGPAAAARLASKWRGGEQPSRDLGVPPWPINRALELIFGAEKSLLPWATLPFGLSLIGVVRRTAQAGAVVNIDVQQRLRASA